MRVDCERVRWNELQLCAAAKLLVDKGLFAYDKATRQVVCTDRTWYAQVNSLIRADPENLLLREMPSLDARNSFCMKKLEGAVKEYLANLQKNPLPVDPAGVLTNLVLGQKGEKTRAKIDPSAAAMVKKALSEASKAYAEIILEGTPQEAQEAGYEIARLHQAAKRVTALATMA